MVTIFFKKWHFFKTQMTIFGNKFTYRCGIRSLSSRLTNLHLPIFSFQNPWYWYLFSIFWCTWICFSASPFQIVFCTPYIPTHPTSTTHQYQKYLYRCTWICFSACPFQIVFCIPSTPSISANTPDTFHINLSKICFSAPESVLVPVHSKLHSPLLTSLQILPTHPTSTTHQFFRNLFWCTGICFSASPFQIEIYKHHRSICLVLLHMNPLFADHNI